MSRMSVNVSGGVEGGGEIVWSLPVGGLGDGRERVKVEFRKPGFYLLEVYVIPPEGNLFDDLLDRKWNLSARVHFFPAGTSTTGSNPSLIKAPVTPILEVKQDGISKDEPLRRCFQVVSGSEDGGAEEEVGHNLDCHLKFYLKGRPNISRMKFHARIVWWSLDSSPFTSPNGVTTITTTTISGASVPPPILVKKTKSVPVVQSTSSSRLSSRASVTPVPLEGSSSTSSLRDSSILNSSGHLPTPSTSSSNLAQTTGSASIAATDSISPRLTDSSQTTAFEGTSDLPAEVWSSKFEVKRGTPRILVVPIEKEGYYRLRVKRDSIIPTLTRFINATANLDSMPTDSGATPAPTSSPSSNPSGVKTIRLQKETIRSMSATHIGRMGHPDDWVEYFSIQRQQLPASLTLSLTVDMALGPPIPVKTALVRVSNSSTPPSPSGINSTASGANPGTASTDASAEGSTIQAPKGSIIWSISGEAITSETKTYSVEFSRAGSYYLVAEKTDTIVGAFRTLTVNLVLSDENKKALEPFPPGNFGGKQGDPLKWKSTEFHVKEGYQLQINVTGRGFAPCFFALRVCRIPDPTTKEMQDKVTRGFLLPLILGIGAFGCVVTLSEILLWFLSFSIFGILNLRLLFMGVFLAWVYQNHESILETMAERRVEFKKTMRKLSILRDGQLMNKLDLIREIQAEDKIRFKQLKEQQIAETKNE